jgi:PAS domain S-box-containing protein
MAGRRSSHGNGKLTEENQRLKAELEEAREQLRAIREGEVDAIVVAGAHGDQVFSLTGAEAVYRLIFNTMQEAALTVAPDGGILSCNPQFEKLLRVSSGSVIGRALATFIVPGERDAVAAILARSETKPVKARLVFWAQDGAFVPAHVSAHSLPMPDGPSICLIATDLTEMEASLEILRRLREEITAREHTEAALRLSEEKFATAFAANPAAIALTRLVDGRILEVNDTSLAVFGYTREEVIGWTVGERGIWHDPRARTQYVAELRRHRRIRNWEVRFAHKSGTPIDILLSAELIPVRGEEVILSTFLDISARKQAEDRLADQERLLRTILEQATEEIVVRDAEGRLLLANAAVRRYARPALAGPAALEGTPIDAVPALWGDMLDVDGKPIPPDQFPIARALRGERVPPLEFQRIGPRGERRSLLNSVAPLRDDRHAILGAVSISVEITAQKQKEAELREARDALEQRVQARTADVQRLSAELAVAEQRERQRLGEVLHDGLQQLLVGCRLRVELLARAKEPDALQTGCRDVLAMLDRVLTSTRSLTAELSPAVLKEGLVPTLQWLAAWMQDTHHLAVDLIIHDRLPALDEPSRLLLFQSVRELLFNTVKHAEVTHARVEIRVPDNAVQITITDDGVGFDPGKIQGAGVGGLGLPSIKQRMEYLGGTLEIASAPGQGSRFTLTVPLHISS